MKITEEYNDVQITDVIEVTEAKYIGDFAIRVFFTDDTQKLVDFKPFLNKALHPSIKKYLNEDLFKAFKIVEGNIDWNDYDLIFPIHQLHSGEIK